jgi:hypothetical protein
MRTASHQRLLLASTILAAACGRTDGMIRYLPKSSSPVLKAAQIVQIRVDLVEAPDWGDHMTRQARLHMTVTDVWKGELHPGSLVLTVTQNRPLAGGLIFPRAGCWQDGRLAAGEHWIVFARLISEIAGDVLAEGSCMELAPPETAVDIRIADRIESHGLSFPEIVKLVIPGADRIHQTLAYYFRARFGDLRLEENQNLNAMLDLVTTPALTTPVRVTLLDAVQTYISSSPATTDWHIHRLAVAMFALLSLPKASDMHEDLIETDLPNLLGLTGGAQQQSANAVFSLWPQERPLAGRALESYRGLADTKPLLAWIKER